MAIKTFINGQENGVITFSGNTEPCAVYVNGERQDNISYILQSVEGVNSVEYSSEYKKNIRTMRIDGNTEQFQGVFAPQNIAIPTAFEQPSSAPIIVSATPITVPNGATLTLTANKTGNGNISSLSSGFIVVISDSRDDIANNYTAILEDYGTPQYLATPKVSGEFYIGIANFLPGGIDNPQAYWDFLRANYTFTLSTEGNTVPNPDFPQPIYNANDNGMSLELKGINLLNTTTPKVPTTTAGITNTTGNNIVILNGKATNSSNFVAYPFWSNINFEAGKTYSGRLKMLSGTVVYGGVSIYVYQGGSYLTTLGQIDNATVGKISVLKHTFTQAQIDKGITIRVGIRGTIGSTAKNAEFENATFQMEIVEGSYTSTTFPNFEPYFTPTTIAIPSSVTVDGTNVPLRFSIYDKIIVDRLNGKVTYSSGTWYTEFKGSESFYQSSFAESSGYGRYYIFAFDIPALGGYCSHFKRSGWLGSKTVKNVFSWVEVNSKYNRIAFKTDGNTGDTFANSLVEFKALLKSLYDTGTPVTVLAKLKTPVETVLYDKANKITTDLGQELLALANSTQNATNIITITSTPSVSKLSVNYAKYGGTQ